MHESSWDMIFVLMVELAVLGFVLLNVVTAWNKTSTIFGMMLSSDNNMFQKRGLQTSTHQPVLDMVCK